MPLSSEGAQPSIGLLSRAGGEELVKNRAEIIEKLVRRLAKGSKGRMTFKFLQSGSTLRVR